MLTRDVLVRVGLVAALGFAGTAATAARASLFCDPETSECPPPGPPPGPPPLPSLPSQGVSTYGTIFIQRGTIQNDGLLQGYIQDGYVTYFGHGAPTPIGGDGSLTVSGTSTSLTLAPVISPLASAEVTASATPAQDQNFPGFGLVARGSLTVGYLVVLHANNQAAADSLHSLLATSGAIASISGNYSVGGTDSFWSSVTARTGVNELGAGLGGSFYKACSLIGYNGTPADCGSGNYALPLDFVSGSSYAHGSPLDFISSISLSASANAGPVNLGYYIGTAHAFIDPVISFANGIDPSQFSLSVGSAPNPVVAGVPEPANWAMLIAGFGLTGAVARRRRAARVVVYA